MPTIGTDCEIILDSSGYFIKPGTFRMKQPRVRKAVVRADNGESYVDLGPGKRIWSMIVLSKNDTVKYDGSSAGQTGQQIRDQLRTSYATVAAALSFTDPIGTVLSVHFDSYAEIIVDLHTQQIPLSTGAGPGASYEIAIELVEV
jgi:hypothetical protein